MSKPPHLRFPGALPDPWRIDPVQEIDSAGTNVRTVPRAFRLARFVPGTLNADIGGGRFDDATAALAALGVENVVFDPFNRPPAHNRAAAARLRGGGAATATVCNVLNVVADPAARDRVVALAADAVGSGGTAWFQVYEGDAGGVGRRTPRGWQENRRLASYLPEVAVHFAEAAVAGGVIAARGALAAPWRVLLPDGTAQVRTLEQAEALLAAYGLGPAAFSHAARSVSLAATSASQ